MTVNVPNVLSRGGVISIELGRLVIRPESRKPVPQDWFHKHSLTLIREILIKLGIEAYEYDSYSTGYYGRHKAPGVTLQLPSVVSRLDTHAIFNADLTRNRNTTAGAKGTPLPKGHFHIGKRSHLFNFWQSSGLPFPNRLSSLYDYMGNLQGILFTGTPVGGHRNRLNAGSLRPLSISANEIRGAFTPDSDRTITKQLTDINQTNLPDKDTTPAQQNQPIEAKRATGDASHGKAVISECGYTVVSSSLVSRKRPQDQTPDEWLDDYCLPADDNARGLPKYQGWD